jgi:hypothetical protein
MIKETIDLLGRKAKDRVTGFTGVITSVCFDLYGCVQCAVNAPAKEGEELKSGHWFDVGRLEVTGKPVIDVPDFDARGNKPATYDKGPADKMSPGI